MRQLRHTIAAGLLAALSVVCLAQTPSLTSPEGVAKVTHLTGQVSVLKDSNPWVLEIGSVVQMKQTIVTGADGFARLQVSDGSTFDVYPNSRVVFRNNPSNWKDLLDLWIGRVKVHIEKIGGQPNHNNVRTPTAVISVRGTIFDVEVETEDTTLVSVEEGLVAVQHAYLPVTAPKEIHPGEYIRVYKNQPLAEKTVDRGEVVRRGLRAAGEAFYRVIFNGPQVAGGGSTGKGPSTGGGGAAGGGTAGDPNGPKKPPAPPPPPPPGN